MRGLEIILTILGLLLVAASIGMLVQNPPASRTGMHTIPIPYTTYRLIPPGNHTLTTSTTLNTTSVSLELPRDNATIMIPSRQESNCSLTRVFVRIEGKGLLPAVNNTTITIYFYKIINNTVLPINGSPLTIPLNAENLSSGEYSSAVQVVTCKKAGCNPTETTTNPKPFYYFINHKLDNTTINVEVRRPNPNQLQVRIWPASLELQPSISGLKIMTESNITGKLAFLVEIKGECTYHYHINAPIYVPQTQVSYKVIYYSYFDPGSLAFSLATGITGLTLLLLSLLLRLHYNKTLERHCYSLKQEE